MPGFEPGTSAPRKRRATMLRYTPTLKEVGRPIFFFSCPNGDLGSPKAARYHAALHPDAQE